jgi:hypothetical protein
MPISGHDVMDGFERSGVSEARHGRMGVGLVISGLLHTLAALLVCFSWPGLMQAGPPPPSLVAIPINLVGFGPETGARQSQQTGVLSQQPPETSNKPPPNLASSPQSPPSRSVFNQPRSEVGSDSLAAAKLQPSPKIQLPKPLPAGSLTPASATKSTKASAPPDLQAQLEALARQQQIQAQQEVQANSSVAFNGGEAAPNSSAAYRVKDFIRAQIERHWYLDRAATGAGDFSVSLHLQLQRDGRVMSAEIVGGGSFAASDAYRSAASSLRAAALLSSPLALPPGRYEDVKDIELIFRPKDVIQ